MAAVLARGSGGLARGAIPATTNRERTTWGTRFGG
jgi:hypothetical protein